MATLILPIAKVDDVDNGQDLAVTDAAATVVLDAGLYKIAAVGTSLKWKLGTGTTVTDAIGSYLADGDQELIRVPDGAAADRTLGVIRSANASDDGALNIVVANLFDVPGVEPRNY